MVVARLTALAAIVAACLISAPGYSQSTIELLFREDERLPQPEPVYEPRPSPLSVVPDLPEEVDPALQTRSKKRKAKIRRAAADLPDAEPEASLGRASGGPRPEIEPREPRTIALKTNEREGTVLINSSRRELYYVLGDGLAYRYKIAVGKEGFSWAGTERVSNISEWPDWYPPKEMRERKPELPEMMEGGMRNPLGARAIYLGSTLYRIHGTNDPRSIGSASSSGCFRMNNRDVVHLASLITIGTKVKVIDSFKRTAPRVAAGDESPKVKAAGKKTRKRVASKKRPAIAVSQTELPPLGQ
jgi:lipoprotein-anchoring transpeptidase ErfK/SrfK